MSASASPPRSKVAALVLAAGRSSRMGDANKLLLPLDAVRLGPASDLIVTSNADRRSEVFAGGGQL